MQFNSAVPFLAGAFLLAEFVLSSTAQTITENATGSQGGYTYEYWKDTGTGTMTLGTGGNFTCSWSNINNILFRKGLRPGVKDQIITFSATYNPSGNSYMAVYGWTQNPLIEYYIIESWGTWRPPGGTSTGTITSDGGTYDIYETTRTNQPSIEGTATFQQYWSVRQSKRTSGTITCANHFNAWANNGMAMGSMYEVSFVVEGYQSSGSADVTMAMSTSTGIKNSSDGSSKMTAVNGRGAIGQNHIEIIDGGPRTITFVLQENKYASLKVYNVRGQEVASVAGRDYSAGQHSVTIDASSLSKGVYCYTLETADR